MLNKEWTYNENKAWLTRIARHGCVITGATNRIQLHRVLGRKAKNNKLWIGQRFAIPLHFDLHDIYGLHPLNVTNNKNGFIAQYGKQSDRYYTMCMSIKEDDGSIPITDEELQAIMDTNA